MKHHLLIAGTGRAGTSFLVQYLTACGLDTHLTRNPEDRLDENANAGLEDFPTGDANLPYVIKSPWLYEFIDELLARDDIQVDAVIIPMRDIVEAATSRVVNELRARLGHEDIPGELTRWHTWGVVPGGTVYSLNPIDQARLLSMGFHQVIHACVKKRVPLIFLEFPRFITDGEYLYEQLRPVLAEIDSSAAIRAHAQTAQPDKVRIGGELANSANIAKGDLFPDFDALDRIALHREITNARRDRDIHRAEAEHLRSLIIDVEQRPGGEILSAVRIQLFVDEGNGFSEEHSSSQTIDQKERSTRYVFNIDRAIDIKALRLDPVDDSAVLIIEDAVLVGPNGSISLMGKLTSNSSFSADGILYFESKDPQIIFDDIPANSSDKYVVRLEFQINLLKTGVDAQLACAKLACQQGETRTRELEAEVTRLRGALHAHVSAREEQSRLTQSLEDAHRQTLQAMQLELARHDTEHAAAMELLKAQFETATRSSDEQQTRLTQSLEDAHRQTLQTMKQEHARRDTEHAAAMELLKAQFETATRISDEQQTQLTQSLEDAHRQTLQALKQDLAQRDTQHKAAIELLKAQFEAAARISEEQQTALAQEYKTTNATLKASHATALELQAEKQRATHESAIGSLRSAHQNAVRAIEDRIREVIEQQIVELDTFSSTNMSWFATAESMLDQFDGLTGSQRLQPIDVTTASEPAALQQPAVLKSPSAQEKHSLGLHDKHASSEPDPLAAALAKLASELAQYEPSSRGSQSSLGNRYIAALASLRHDHAHAAEQFSTRNHQLLKCQLENLAQADRKHGNEAKDLTEQIEALEATIETIRKWKGFRTVAWLNERRK
ncbi:hypothetical protein [Burkholderia anthina]|uniref:hypothetical protein n=1 Tax=Burkholderia anthina TaxID=179879 RepID=UPI00158B3D8E|nr:hypothetical protein [Burkholderia anthina]